MKEISGFCWPITVPVMANSVTSIHLMTCMIRQICSFKEMQPKKGCLNVYKNFTTKQEKGGGRQKWRRVRLNNGNDDDDNQWRLWEDKITKLYKEQFSKGRMEAFRWHETECVNVDHKATQTWKLCYVFFLLFVIVPQRYKPNSQSLSSTSNTTKKIMLRERGREREKATKRDNKSGTEEWNFRCFSHE